MRRPKRAFYSLTQYAKFTLTAYKRFKMVCPAIITTDRIYCIAAIRNFVSFSQQFHLIKTNVCRPFKSRYNQFAISFMQFSKRIIPHLFLSPFSLNVIGSFKKFVEFFGHLFLYVWTLNFSAAMPHNNRQQAIGGSGVAGFLPLSAYGSLLCSSYRINRSLKLFYHPCREQHRLRRN